MPDERWMFKVGSFEFGFQGILDLRVMRDHQSSSPIARILTIRREIRNESIFGDYPREMRTRDLRVVLSFFGRWSGNPQTEFAYPLRNKLNKTSWTLNSSRSLRRSPTALPSTERLFPTNLQMMSCTSLRKWWIVNKSLLKISNNSN